MTGQPTLLAVAHGTTDPDGLAEIRRLINIVRTKRPDLPIELCWLDRAEPSFSDALAALTGPVVVVPVLLSTGYHVKIDITAVVAGRLETAVAAQLGPDERITEVVRQRLRPGRDTDADEVDVVLFATGSSDPEAAEQLSLVAGQLDQLLRADESPNRFTVHARTLAQPDGWLDGITDRFDAANYLLAPGRFNDLLRTTMPPLGAGFVAPPIGAHPLVAAVIIDRYEEAAALLVPGSAESRCRG
jgi:sirohydrochlorin ferrochelatase